MARLVINPGSPAAWEIQLKPGSNSFGRGQGNDFQITDPSVSGSHCQIVVDSTSAFIKDLGSTNGTFVNRTPVKESLLQTGQVIHLGGVAMAFYSDTPATAVGGPPQAVVTAAPRIAGTAPVARISGSPPVARMVGPPAVAAPPVVEAPPPIVAAPPASSGPHPCKFHPKSPARYYCAQCQKYFCEFCVNSRTAGGAQHKTCRQCAVDLAPVEVAAVDAGEPERFFGKLPGTFAYPFRGAGPFILLVSMIVIAALDFISGGFGLITRALFYGYLFAFMQNIIHSTASQEVELPGWPAWDNIGGCAVRLLVCVLFSFGPAIGLFFYALHNEEPAAGIAMIPAVIFGCFYFPMALLAVAMKDSSLSANPLVVLPAIVKVPVEYIVTVILLAAVIAVRRVGDIGLAALFPRGLATHSMIKLFEMFGARVLWNFIGLYLLTVNMRILGLLYLARKRKLGWFAH